MECDHSVIRRKKTVEERTKGRSEEEKRTHPEEKPQKLLASPSDGVSTDGTLGASRRRYDAIAFVPVLYSSVHWQPVALNVACAAAARDEAGLERGLVWR